MTPTLRGHGGTSSNKSYAACLHRNLALPTVRVGTVGEG